MWVAGMHICTYTHTPYKLTHTQYCAWLLRCSVGACCMYIRYSVQMQMQVSRGQNGGGVGLERATETARQP